MTNVSISPINVKTLSTHKNTFISHTHIAASLSQGTKNLTVPSGIWILRLSKFCWLTNFIGVFLPFLNFTYLWSMISKVVTTLNKTSKSRFKWNEKNNTLRTCQLKFTCKKISKAKQNKTDCNNTFKIKIIGIFSLYLSKV